jgi:lipopolysaccharide biosynthesis glycosyltransferase
MKKLPIVFNFNDAYVVQAGVCITSLLENINKDFFCDIFIMYSSNRLTEYNKGKIISLKNIYKNCEFTFLDVKDSFKDGHVHGRIPIDAYFRLLIPEYIKNYDKVIYSDVDVIFAKDISNVIDINISNYFCAAVRADLTGKNELEYINTLGIDTKDYINAGFLLLNIDKIIKENIFNKKILPLLNKSYLFQDQDIINLAFKGNILSISNKYNYITSKSKYSCADLSTDPVVFHYVEHKPWNALAPFNDIWWEYYRKSIFFDDDFYKKYHMYIYSEYIKYHNLFRLLEKFKILRVYDFFVKIIPGRIKGLLMK